MARSDSRRGGSQPTPSGDTLFPARLQAGEISTAAAVHNPGEERIVVSCRLMSKSTVLEEVEIPLGGQRADVLAHRLAFPAADTSDFVGSVRCDAVGEGRFSAVALEMDPAIRTFITLPVFPVPEMPSQE